MIHPDYNKYTEYPEVVTGMNYTHITLIHPYHGTVQLYVPIDVFQDQLRGMIAGAWANGATILIQPME